MAVRTIVSAVFLVYVSGLEDARIIFIGNADAWIRLTILQKNIVAWIVFLDKTVF
jgi:hypothetical protein